MFSNPSHHPNFPPIIFDLASGDKIRVALKVSWPASTKEDQLEGRIPFTPREIIIFTDEDTYPRKYRLIDEIKPQHEYQPEFSEVIWQWLSGHAVSRERFDHDCTDDFIALFHNQIERLATEDLTGVNFANEVPDIVDAEHLDTYDERFDTPCPELRSVTIKNNLK